MRPGDKGDKVANQLEIEWFITQRNQQNAFLGTYEMAVRDTSYQNMESFGER